MPYILIIWGLIVDNEKSWPIIFLTEVLSEVDKRQCMGFVQVGPIFNGHAGIKNTCIHANFPHLVRILLISHIVNVNFFSYLMVQKTHICYYGVCS